MSQTKIEIGKPYPDEVSIDGEIWVLHECRDVHEDYVSYTVYAYKPQDNSHPPVYFIGDEIMEDEEVIREIVAALEEEKGEGCVHYSRGYCHLLGKGCPFDDAGTDWVPCPEFRRRGE